MSPVTKVFKIYRSRYELFLSDQYGRRTTDTESFCFPEGYDAPSFAKLVLESGYRVNQYGEYRKSMEIN